MSSPSYGPGIEITGRITPEYAADPDARGGRVRGQAAARVRRPPRRAARPARRAPGGARRRQAARLPAGDARDPRRRLDLRADSRRHRRPPRRDHRPGRPQDGHQRAQLRRERVHGRLRGRQHAELGQQHPGPHQPARRDPPPDRLHVARGQGVPAEREDRGAVRAAARLAPAREARADRRRSRSPAASSTSRSTSSTTRRSCSRAAAGPTSTCRSSRATSRRGCGTTSS